MHACAIVPTLDKVHSGLDPNFPNIVYECSSPFLPSIPLFLRAENTTDDNTTALHEHRSFDSC